MSLKSKASRLVKLFGIAMVAGLTMAGCTTAATESTSTGTETTEQKVVSKDDIVFVASVINTTNPYFAANIAGAQALAKKLGVPIEIVDSEGSSQVQNSKIQAILAKGKTVVMFVNTVSSADAPIIVEATKAAGGFVTSGGTSQMTTSQRMLATTSLHSRSTLVFLPANVPLTV